MAEGIAHHLVCLGLNYRTTPVEVRERVAFAESQLEEALQQLKQMPALEECVILSTCNRVEIYAQHEANFSAEQATTQLLQFLIQHFQLSAEQAQALTTYTPAGPEAARHLYRVVSGLDSMVLGETEIFGQVKTAYQRALAAGTTSRSLNKLFQNAFAVGKKVRHETHIQRGSTSVGSVAVDLAEKIHDLRHCRIMLIGAGEMSRTCAQSLLSRGAQSIIVSNRNYERAVELAAEMQGQALRFDEWESVLTEVDVIISSTSAPHFILQPEQMRQVMRKRRWSPLLLIDIAVPRDIDPTVNEIEGIYLYDIDHLQAIADEGRRERERHLSQCEEIIQQQLTKHGIV
jgi:glutamyl-tRNA reductase